MGPLVVVAIGLGLLVGRLRGGRMAEVGRHRLAVLPVLFLALVAQVVAIRTDVPVWVLTSSWVLLLLWVVANRRLLGAPLLALGVVANGVVIGMNGAMPVRPAAVVSAGVASAAEEPTLDYGHEHRRQRPRDHLVVLADTIPVPVPGARQVLSAGDLLLSAGVVAAVAGLTMPPAGHLVPRRRRRRAPTVGRTT